MYYFTHSFLLNGNMLYKTLFPTFYRDLILLVNFIMTPVQNYVSLKILIFK